MRAVHWAIVAASARRCFEFGLFQAPLGHAAVQGFGSSLAADPSAKSEPKPPWMIGLQACLRNGCGTPGQFVIGTGRG
jgi:hypothetical protein